MRYGMSIFHEFCIFWCVLLRVQTKTTAETDVNIHNTHCKTIEAIKYPSLYILKQSYFNITGR